MGGDLRERREALGLTRGQLADRLGVSVETVSAIEAGRPPRHATMHSYLRKVSGLEAHELLGVPARHAPEACPAAWHEIARLHGLSAKGVRIDPEELSIVGLGFVDDEVELVPELLRALIQVAFVGSPGVLRRLTPGTRRYQSGSHLHEWAVRGDRVDYRRTGPAKQEISVDYPIRRLLLADPVGAGRLSVRSDVAPELELSREMHPRGVSSRDGHFRVTHAHPGLRYAVVEDGGARTKRWSLGGRVQEARAESGLSVRRFASLAGLSVGEIPRLEAGGNPQWRTLRGCIEALPDLSPQELVPGPAAPRTRDREQTWDYLRRLHGIECRQLVKTVTYDVDGRYATVIEMVGIRSIRESWRDARLRIPTLRNVTGFAPDRLESIITECLDDPKIRRQAFDEGRVAHELRWPRSVARDGFTYIRHYAPVSAHALTASDAIAKFGGSPPFNNGVTLPVFYAARRARLEVSFPPGYDPLDITTLAWSQAFFPSLSIPSLGEKPPKALVRRRDGRLHVAIAIDSPMPSLGYGIGWQLPERYQERPAGPSRQ